LPGKVEVRMNEISRGIGVRRPGVLKKMI